MSNKIKGLWLGLYFILIGALFIVRQYFDFSYSAMLWFILSLACFFVYKNSNLKWPLVPCTYFIYFGAAVILKELGIDTFLLTTCMFFVVPGIVFLILFFDRKNNKYLTYSSFFLCIGAFIILNRLTVISLWGIAFICIGLGIIIIAALKKR